MIRVGPAGWSYADWEGIVYPRPKPRGFHPLQHLGRYVTCVEVNATFYALPRTEHVARWAEIASGIPDFRVAVKLHRDLTHGSVAADERERRAVDFLMVVDPLRRAQVLGPILVQFPVSFTHGPRGLRRLEETRAWLEGLDLVVELRHRSWFEPNVLTHVGALGYSVAAIDLPAAREHPPEEHATPGAVGYLRLHGRNAAAWFDKDSGRDAQYDYLYSADELGGLVERAKRLAGGHDETYVVTNNHFSGKAVANALEIRQRLEGGPVAAPRELIARYPHLAEMAWSPGQQELFP